MNRKKLARRGALAAKIAARWNPPYRIVSNGLPVVAYQTREEARRAKRACAGEAWIEQKQADGSYLRIR